MARIAIILSWVAGTLAVLCALTFFGQNLLAAVASASPLILVPMLAPLIWYSIRLGENNVVNYVVGWQRWVVAGLFLFVMLNFAVHSQSLNEGTPEIQEGRYIVSNHGTFVRELTKTEYDDLQLTRIRLSSSYPILFFAIAAFGWQGVSKRVRVTPQ